MSLRVSRSSMLEQKFKFQRLSDEQISQGGPLPSVLERISQAPTDWPKGVSRSPHSSARV